MAQLNPRLTRRTVVLVKVETTPGTDPVPSPTTDGLLVSAPDFTVDNTELERDFVRNDLSPLGYVTGRIIAHMKFELEMRGNGSEQSGLIGNVPVWGRCLRACGMAESLVPAGAGQVGAVRDMLNVGGGTVVSWAANVGAIASPLPQGYGDYLLTCVLAGASGTAKIRVDELNGYEPLNLANENINITETSVSGALALVNTAASGAGSPLTPTITVSGTWASGDVINFNVNGYVGQLVLTSGQAATTSTVATALAGAISGLGGGPFTAAAVSAVVTITYTGTAAGVIATTTSSTHSLGSSGVTLTPTFASPLVLGQQWKVSVSPTGVAYQPISQNFEFFTFYMYMDGYLHKMTASQGTFSFAATAGQFGKFTFEFSGNYLGPIDAVLPTPVLVINPVPPIFALAKLRLYSENITISQFTYTHANTVAPRDDANSANGYFGVRITARKPVGGVDPEATQVGDFDFWTRMANSDYMQFSAVFGATAGSPSGVPGNTIWVKAPNVQSTKTTYKDRTGIRVYDMGLGFARESGDDEIRLLFA